MTDPWTDYRTTYDEAYYEGRGSDPGVDYAYEFVHADRTIRQYEWRGLFHAVSSLRPVAGRWLDYGCGNGGLVRYVRAHSTYEIMGFDTGAWADKARTAGLPIVSPPDLEALRETCDVVTAVEVIEHCVDPIAVLRDMRRLLKPGGVLFLTTGNADTAPEYFPDWYYVNPEIHVSYFTPRALQLAFAQTGFAAVRRQALPGWNDVLRFKVLKKLGIRNVNAFERLLPWQFIGRWVERKTQLSAHPLGRAM